MVRSKRIYISRDQPESHGDNANLLPTTIISLNSFDKNPTSCRNRRTTTTKTRKHVDFSCLPISVLQVFPTMSTSS
jgi:hypothetical protein